MISTPQYIFNSKIITESFKHMSKCLETCDVYYALKANSETEILDVLNRIGAKFEIASEGELNKLIDLNVSPERIICSLPVKKEEMIQHLYDYGCKYFVFDCIDELEKIKRIAPGAIKVLRVYINDIGINNIPFGMELSEIHKQLKGNSDFRNDIDGITFYIRKNYNSEITAKVIDRCENILRELEIDKIKYLNIGGNYRLVNQAGQEFYDQINKRLLELSNRYNLKLIAEVGRSVVKFSGRLYTRVELIKDRGEYSEVFIDAGLPTGISYAPERINVLNRQYDHNQDQNDQSQFNYLFYGITCSHALLFEKKLVNKLQPGDILEFEDFGSYSICKHSHFHGWEKPLMKLNKDKVDVKVYKGKE